MGFFSRLFGRNETRAIGSNYLPGYLEAFGVGGYNDTGVAINEDNALISSAVFSCCTTIAQTVSPLPCKVYDRVTKEIQYDHPLASLLSLAPNDFMTAIVFFETMLFQAGLWGFSVAVIDKDQRGNPIALYPLESGRTRAIRKEGQLLFESRIGNEVFTFTPDQVVYLLGWTRNGITPVSPVQMSRQAIGLAVAMERFAAKSFSGTSVGGILQMPPGMSDDAMQKFLATWRKHYSGGIDTAFKIAALQDPMKFIQTSTDPEKQQMTQARQDQVLEVARYWRVPPHKLGLLEKSSYASIEAQNLSFLQDCIQPWITKLEQELVLKCLLSSEQSKYEVRFLLDNLLRSDTQARYQAYMTARQAGIMTVNEIRRKENLPPVPEGDLLYAPLNMVPLGQQPPATGNNTNAARSASDLAKEARSLIEDAATRLLVKEAKALGRAVKKYQGKPSELRTWVQDFYKSHLDMVTRVMAAPIRAVGANVAIDQYAKTHCEQSQRDIESLIEGRCTIDDIAYEWTENRADDIADLLTKGDSNGNAKSAA